MHKQCNYCGDYFFTTIPDRQFCSHKCQHNNPVRKPMSKFGVQIVPRKKMKRLDGTDGLPCNVCGILTFLPLLEAIRWQGRDKNVCEQCLEGLSERVEEVGLDISDLLPSPIGLD